MTEDDEPGQLWAHAPGGTMGGLAREAIGKTELLTMAIIAHKMADHEDMDDLALHWLSGASDSIIRGYITSKLERGL